MNKQKIIRQLAEVTAIDIQRVVQPYTWTGHIPFAMYLTTLLKPDLFIELGTHSGNSFNAFCQHIKYNQLNTQCVAVDCWEGDEQAGFYGEDIYQSLLEHQQSNYKDFAKLKRSYFDDAVHDFADGSIDLLHIDGLHTYEAVKNDFDTWRCKLSDKAVVLFHDTQVFDREFGVYKLWQELLSQYQGFEFFHSHGLGVLLVGDKVPAELVEFIAFSQANEKWVRRLFYTQSLLMVPVEASIYLTELELKSQKEQSNYAISVELYESDSMAFCDSNKFFKHLEFDRKIKDTKLSISFDIQKENTQFIRIDPCHEAIMLADSLELVALVADTPVNLTPIQMNHVDVVDGDILFPSDPQITYQLPTGTTTITFYFSVKAIGDDLYPMYVSLYSALRAETDLLIDKYRVQATQLEEFKQSFDQDISLKDNIEQSKVLVEQLEMLNTNRANSSENQAMLLSLSVLEKELLPQLTFERERCLAFEQAYSKLRFASNQMLSKHMSEQKRLADLLNNHQKKALLDKDSLKAKLTSKQALANKIYQDKADLISQVTDLKDEHKNLIEKINLLENSKALKFFRFFTRTKS